MITNSVDTLIAIKCYCASTRTKYSEQNMKKWHINSQARRAVDSGCKALYYYSLVNVLKTY